MTWVKWDSEEMCSPAGLPDTDDDRRLAWELRCGLSVPEWALTDPRIIAADRLVIAALERASRGERTANATLEEIESALMLLPNEVEEANIIRQWLSQKKEGQVVEILVPHEGQQPQRVPGHGSGVGQVDAVLAGEHLIGGLWGI
jgi:hypothetical protein